MWSNRFVDVEMARSVMMVMMDRPDRWTVWALMAKILGPELLSGMIEAEVVDAIRLADKESQAVRAHAERLAKEKRAASMISAYLVLKGDPRIVVSRGGRRFMVMNLDTPEEARRVWDWVRWQTNSLKDWFDFVQAHGPDVLEQLILESMFAEERDVKAAGLSTAGQRPLRDWRPFDGPEPDEDGGP